MNIEQAQALAMICHYAKEYLKDNKTMSQSVDIAQDIIKKQLNALEIIKELIYIDINGQVRLLPKDKTLTATETLPQDKQDLLKEVML